MMHTGKAPAILQRTINNMDPDTFKNKINLETLLLYSNATLIRVKNIKGYGCMFCLEQFIDPCDLKKHAVKEHSNKNIIKKTTAKLMEHTIKLDITGLNCKICDRNIPKLTDLMAHLKIDHSKELFADVKSQIVPFKFDTKKMICIVCSNEFTTFKLLQEHMNLHFPNYLCNTCDAGFITKKLRDGHEKRHQNFGQFKCNECEKTFPTVQKRRLHHRRTHLLRGKVNKCSYCEERFTDYWKKMDHLIKIHGLPPVDLRCQACDQTFNNRRSLARHTKRDHLLERKYECPDCDKKFFDRSTLEQHKGKHTGLTAEFKCEICSKTYRRWKTLREHKKIHSSVRKYNCVQCDLGFVQRYAWKTHMRTKHGQMVDK